MWRWVRRSNNLSCTKRTRPCTNGCIFARTASCVLTHFGDLKRDRLGLRSNPGLQPADPAAAHRHHIGVRGGELDQAAVAGALEPNHALDIDDVAAVDPQ